MKHEIISLSNALPVFFRDYTTGPQFIPSHWHQHVEILFILDGAMDITVDHQVYNTVKNDLFIIDSTITHQTRIKDFASVVLIQVPYDLLNQAIPNLDQLSFHTYLSYNSHNDDPSYLAIKACLLEMVHLYASQEPGYPLMFNRYLYELLNLLYTNCTVPTKGLSNIISTKQEKYVTKAIKYIDEHYKEPIALKEMADYLALNPEYFCRIFKKKMGVTFLNYINQVRLTYIYKDLMTTTDSITVIQENHGFTNYKVFNRMFKESYGCTPSAARRKCE